MKPWGIVFGSNLVKTPKNSLSYKRITPNLSPFEVFTRICRHYKYAYLLESIEGPEKIAQYSFLGFDPSLIITANQDTLHIDDPRNQTSWTETHLNPLTRIKSLIDRRPLGAHRLGHRFTGGAVGYVSYDAIRYWESLPKWTIDDLHFPEIELALYDDGLVFDHQQQQCYYYSAQKDRSHDLKQLFTDPVDLDPLHYTDPILNLSKEQFETAVTRAKEYIAAGDILQVVLSKRYEFTVTGDLLAFYKVLRQINPSPYMYYLKHQDRQIIGASPEMLVRVENGTVETYPIAGTRPRVEDPNTNKILAQELLADPKERAEHLMLVDLARNDVGKVAEFGSVHVPQFMEVHEYSHVQHIVSRVVGKLRPHHDSYDALTAIFPAGTVSGAPKIRAMEIIEESEPTRRGPYAGAVGYFAYNGNSDFAITIRTLIASGKKASIQVGAGIVADSDPEREWFETDHKAQALIRALEVSGGNHL